MISETNRTQADFAAQYRDMSDDAVLQLAIEGGLLPEADAALRAELKRRSIGSKDVKSFRVKQMNAKLQMSVGHNPSHRGTGFSLQGHKFLTGADQEKGIVVVTRWIVFFYMPLIPIGSYRVKKFVNAKPEIVGEVPLQWDQVLQGWKKAAMIILGIICAAIAVVLWEHLQGR